jgi:hypothetical protein
VASISPQRRDQIIDALRRGTVPQSSLDAFAVGLDRFEAAIDDELRKVSAGGSVFKAVRGEYGCGKTFFARWLADRARKMGFASTEVQISETETPLHRLETVYRRLNERLATADTTQGALRNIVDGWFFTLEEDVLAEGSIAPNDASELLKRTNELLERRLADVARTAPTFSAALRGYRQAQVDERPDIAEGILAWLSGQPNVASEAKRFAGVKGDIDHFGALNFLQGILTILRDSGHVGMLIVLDEVETIQRVRSDVRDKSLNALRQLIDEVDSGRFPGLYLLITGTAAFFGDLRVSRGWSHSPSVSTSISRRTSGSTTRGPCKSDSPRSPWKGSDSLGARFETSTASMPFLRSVLTCCVMIIMSRRWLTPWRGSWVARLGCRPVSSSRSSFPMFWTGSTSLRISTHVPIMH